MKTKLFILKSGDTTELDEFIKYVEVVSIQYQAASYSGSTTVQHFAFLTYKP